MLKEPMVHIFNYQAISEDIDFQKVKEETLAKGFSLLYKGKAPLNFIFQTSHEMRRMNKKFREKDYRTDVISFEPQKLPDGSYTVAEVYICPEYIQELLKSTLCTADLIGKKLFMKETLRVMIHGMLHTEGYDHEVEFRYGFDLIAIDILKKESKMEDMYVEQERRLQKLYEILQK